MNHAIFGRDPASTVCVPHGLVHYRPVLRVHALLPLLEGPVVGAGREAVHRLEIGRPAVLALPDLPFEGDGASRLLRELEHLLARAQLFLDTFALGDVARDALIALEPALLVENRCTAYADVA